MECGYHNIEFISKIPNCKSLKNNIICRFKEKYGKCNYVNKLNYVNDLNFKIYYNFFKSMIDDWLIIKDYEINTNLCECITDIIYNILLNNIERELSSINICNNNISECNINLQFSEIVYKNTLINGTMFNDFLSQIRKIIYNHSNFTINISVLFNLYVREILTEKSLALSNHEPKTRQLIILLTSNIEKILLASIPNVQYQIDLLIVELIKLKSIKYSIYYINQNKVKANDFLISLSDNISINDSSDYTKNSILFNYLIDIFNNERIDYWKLSIKNLIDNKFLINNLIVDIYINNIQPPSLYNLSNVITNFIT